MRIALSDKLNEQKILVLTGFDLEEIKTRAFLEVLKRFETENALVVTAEYDEVLDKSSRNLPTIKVLGAEGAQRLRHLEIRPPGSFAVRGQPH